MKKKKFKRGDLIVKINYIKVSRFIDYVRKFLDKFQKELEEAANEIQE